jgi:hypothetical protein
MPAQSKPSTTREQQPMPTPNGLDVILRRLHLLWHLLACVAMFPLSPILPQDFFRDMASKKIKKLFEKKPEFAIQGCLRKVARPG